MIRRFFAPTGIPIDAASRHQIRSLRRQQEMIDANAVILVPRPGLIIPERIVERRRIGGAKRFGETKVLNLEKRGAAFG